jgi:hypothetical protein
LRPSTHQPIADYGFTNDSLPGALFAIANELGRREFVNPQSAIRNGSAGK